MININSNILNALNLPSRKITARVELYKGSTLEEAYNKELLATYCHDGPLIEATIDRMGDDGKFFGFGICQKLTIKLLDRERAINIPKGGIMEISFGINGDYMYPCPLFRVEEVSRDESTNDLTVIAYDFLYKAGEHRVSELGLTSYTIGSFVQACANILSLPVKIEVDDSCFGMECPNGANFDGTETLREALNAVAEATQCIYFVDWDWRLTFRRLDKNAEPVLHIDKSKYFTLSNKTDRTLAAICHATELNDNVEAAIGNSGVVQYVRNNPFWDLRDDIADRIQHAIEVVGGMTMSQFECQWRGNFALEIGDAFTIATKDNGVLVGFLLNDTLKYNGGLSETMGWHFTDHNGETANSPVNIGDAIKQTYARVNKAEKTIELAVKDTLEFEDRVENKITELTLTTDGITAEVSRVENKFNGEITNLNSKITQTAESITSEVNRVENKLDDGMISLNSTINQTAESITSEVNRVENKFNGEITNLNSTISQTAESITSEVSRVEKKVDNSITTLGSQITQNADSITSTVSRVEGIEDDITTMESQIQQTADAIELKVSKGDIISAINMSPESIDISADKLNLTGYITASDLSGAGKTTINGSNITTGTISADRINMTGAIDWSDLSTSCRNTVASYAGQDGEDADLPSYIKNTYIAATEIRSPTIYGATIYAGLRDEGHCKMTASGLNVVSDTGGNVCGIGWEPGYYNLPYVVLGQGVDDYGTDSGMIKKYTHGIWIGDSDSAGAYNQQRPTAGTGIFVDFVANKVYKYINGTSSEIIGNTSTMTAGLDDDIPEDTSTDYIVETGTVSPWTYRKWNSGIAECWCKKAVSTKITTAWGALYSSGELTATDINFPFTFAEVPNVQTSVYNNGAGVFIMAAGNWNPPSTTATGSYELVRGTQNTTATSYGINYYVIGRWK